MVSIESRVVSATSLTMTRCSPATALRSDDLPALGRPTMATGTGCRAGASSARASAAAPSSPRTGSAATAGAAPLSRPRRRRGVPSRRSGASATATPPTASSSRSSRSPMPRPCRAEIGHGLAETELVETDRLGAAAGRRACWPTRITGTRARRSTSAISWSSARDPAARRRRRARGSASARAAATCSRIGAAIGEPAAVSKPPVSTRRMRRPRHSISCSLRSRVTPGRLVDDGGADRSAG